MKKAEEYLQESVNKVDALLSPWYENGIYDGYDYVILEAIKSAQLEAIEETVKLCAENAVTKYEFVSTGDYSGFDNWIVNKQSIMNCAEILKEQL